MARASETQSGQGEDEQWPPRRRGHRRPSEAYRPPRKT